jgi:hypothetical protein
MDHDELDRLLVPRPDDIVDRKYRVRERLGTGGMGIVFRVEHLHTGRTYALKVLRPALAATPEGQRRFEAEARAIGALRHPNVVDVVDLGYAGTGSGRFPYLVMERLEAFPQSHPGGAGLPAVGQSVLERLSRGRRAHAAGIAHGDLKPENVVDAETAGGFDVKVSTSVWRAGGRCPLSRPGRHPTAHGEQTTVPSETTLRSTSSLMSGIAGPRTCRPERLRGERLSRCRRTALACSPTASSRVVPSSDETPSTARERLAAATRRPRPRARRGDGRPLADPR